MQFKARVIGSARSGAVENRAIWQSHNNRPDDDETDEDRSQDRRDYDEDNKGGFGIDVSSHL